MANKTEYGSYNEDDFVEVDGNLKELTVTITLCEYRNLIIEMERLATTNADLYQKWNKEKERADILCKALVARCPELQRELSDVLEYAYGVLRPNGEGDNEEGESDE